MAITFVLLRTGLLPGGKKYEAGTWAGVSTDTSGEITTSTAAGPKIKRIKKFSVSSNGDTAVDGALDVLPTTLKITFTASDGGTYYIEGPTY